MPHSSGGGSHRGGSHSSSHRSHSSRRSGSGSASGRHVRSSYFSGSRRFVYLHRNTPTYIYADYDITKKRSPLRFLMLIFYLPFILGIGLIMRGTILPPQKLSADYNTAVVVKDGINVLDDTERLKSSLENFLGKTGITPAVFTVCNEEWQGKYDSLENYAYDLYVNSFRDEKHWLIVYSEPKMPDDDFSDWYWEGMQGDDTDSILTVNTADSFTLRLQHLLTDRSVSVNDALCDSFDELSDSIMKVKIDPTAILILMIFVGFIGVHAYLMVFHDPNRKYRNAVECPIEQPAEAFHEEKCPYCGASYMSGRDTRCPSCQALLEISDKKES